jgi:hypothetical protein
MAHVPLQQLMAWGVLPPAWSVRRPLMGTCGLSLVRKVDEASAPWTAFLSRVQIGDE